MDTQCKNLNKAGKPCSATLYRDGFCYWHHPDLEVQRQADRIAGGKAKSNESRARKRVLGSALDLAQIDNALCAALLDVLGGDLEPGIATAAAGVARAVVSVRQVSDLENRIAVLEGRQGGRTA